MALSSIDASGWSAQYSGTPPTFTPDTAPETVTVSRAGFTGSAVATTYTDALVLTSRVRQPYPNHASLTSNTAALSDYVYSTDTITGVTNNSAEASPKPVANWIMPDRAVVGNIIGGTVCPVEFVAFHRDARNGKEIAAGKFLISDGTSTITVVVSSSVVSGRADDRNAAVVYRLPETDISSLNTGLITVNAEAYPWLGGDPSVAKSATDGHPARGFSPRYFLKDAALNASPYYVYVASGGNDASGAVSTSDATAAAAPCLTVAGAITRLNTMAGRVDGGIIRVGVGSFVIGDTIGAKTQNCAAVTITRDPNVPKSSAIVTFGTSGCRPRLTAGLLSPLTTGRLRLADITVERTGTGTIMGEAANQLEIIVDDGVVWDNNSHSAVWLSNSHDYHYGTTFIDASVAGGFPSGPLEHRIWRGVSIDRNYGAIEGYLVVGCDITRPGALDRGTRTASGSIVAFNRFRDPASGGPMISWGASENVVGCAMTQNVIEYTSAISREVIRVSGDAATGSNTHVVIHHNTGTGFYQHGRANLFYDEGATARTSKLFSCVGNIWSQINTKSDVFRGANEAGADASARVGNWAYEYGVGCRGEFSQFVDANNGGGSGSFKQEYPGLGANIGTSSTVRNDPLFIDYKGTTSGPTGGAGGGDYHLQESSPAKQRLASAVLSHDIAGTARPAANDAAGAYTIPATDTPPTITSASTKSGQVGVALSYTITATGTAPITFSVSGTLPAGVTFDGANTISGTPTTAGARVATITATNSAGEDSDTLTFTIAAAPPTGDEEIIPGEVVRNAADTILLVGEDRVLLLPLIPGEEVYNAAGTLLLVGEVKGSPPPEEN